MRRLAVKLTNQGQRILREGHPWLFDGAIESVKGEGAAGDLAVIFDRKKDKFAGVGLFDPDSPIRIRVLHQGSPVKIDEAFFAERIAAARERRRPLLETETTGYRLLHGENDGLPGLVVDVYADVMVVKLYTPAWFPWLKMLLPLLLRAAGTETAVLRLARNVKPAGEKLKMLDGQVIAGTLADPEVVFTEHGVRFLADVVHGHKTGFFLDHRANRRKVGELADGRDVLDVFSYAGGFSVHALRGNAYRVVSLDISGPALATAARNVALNFSDDPRHETLEADAFEALGTLAKQGESFGLVIVDPPSFAKSAREIPRALDAYRRINTLAIPLVEPGGILLAASCSARVTADEFFATVEKVVKKSGRRFQLLEKTFHDVDHPIGFPEGAYLKSVYYRLK